ncbi:MAG: hypothetical protein GXO22_05745 [Aquificae bacterium]|nr:hypothetical protein [Aquificota bacterium]
MKKYLLITTLFASSLAFSYESELSIDYWTPIPDGYLKKDGTKIGLKSMLKLSTAKDFGGKLLFKEKESSNLPNIVFMYTPISFEGQGTADNPFSYGDITVNSGEDFEALVEYTSYDLGFLWDIGHLREKTEDRLDFRAGFSIRYIERSLKIKTGTAQTTENHKDLKPMLDLEAEVEVLPVHQELRAEIILEAQIYTNGNEYLFDIIDSIRMNYKNLFAEFGYREEKYKMADGMKKVSASGIFWSLGIHF